MSPVKSFKNRYNIECITIGGMNFGILVKRAKYKNKNKIAVIDGQYTLTYNQLYSTAYQLSKNYYL